MNIVLCIICFTCYVITAFPVKRQMIRTAKSHYKVTGDIVSNSFVVMMPMLLSMILLTFGQLFLLDVLGMMPMTVMNILSMIPLTLFEIIVTHDMMKRIRV